MKPRYTVHGVLLRYSHGTRCATKVQVQCATKVATVHGVLLRYSEATVHGVLLR